MPFDGRVTSRYGWRKGRYHNGTDIDLTYRRYSSCRLVRKGSLCEIQQKRFWKPSDYSSREWTGDFLRSFEQASCSSKHGGEGWRPDWS